MHGMTSILFPSVLGLLAGLSSAQLAPERLYHGVGRSIPMTVTVPEGAKGDAMIRLLMPEAVEEGIYEIVAETAASAGRVDLSTMFPVLWTGSEHHLLYAQLFVGPDPVGCAVVLQPMLTPERAHLMINRPVLDPTTGVQVVVPTITQDPEGRAMFEGEHARLLRAAGRTPPEREVVFSGLRTYKDRRVVLDTTLGEIVVALRPDAAPNTAFNFLHLVEGGFYTDIIFHRILPLTPEGAPFVVQVGDPTGGGNGGPGYQVDLEPSRLGHGFGVISMARSADPDTNGSQIFLCLSRAGTRHLDGRYTAFGQMVSGADVLLALAATPVDEDGRASDPPILRSARVTDAPPVGTGPLPVAEPQPEAVGR